MNPQPKLDNKELFNRVNHLEQNQSAMQTDISTIKATMERVVNMLSTASKTNWGVVAAFVTVGLMIMTPILYNIKSDNERERSERIALSLKLAEFRKEVTDREVQRAKEDGKSEALAELNRQHIDALDSHVTGMLQNRFTDNDGDRLRTQLMDRIEDIEKRVFDHQSHKNESHQ